MPESAACPEARGPGRQEPPPHNGLPGGGSEAAS